MKTLILFPLACLFCSMAGGVAAILLIRDSRPALTVPGGPYIATDSLESGRKYALIERDGLWVITEPDPRQPKRDVGAGADGVEREWLPPYKSEVPGLLKCRPKTKSDNYACYSARNIQLPGYLTGHCIALTPDVSNIGPATVSVDSLQPVPILKPAFDVYIDELQYGELAAGKETLMCYDGHRYVTQKGKP